MICEHLRKLRDRIRGYHTYNLINEVEEGKHGVPWLKDLSFHFE